MSEQQQPSITVRKIGTRVPVSVELMLSEGAITEGEAREMGWTPPPAPPRLRALRWRAAWWWAEHRPRVHLGPCDVDD